MPSCRKSIFHFVVADAAQHTTHKNTFQTPCSCGTPAMVHTTKSSRRLAEKSASNAASAPPKASKPAGHSALHDEAKTNVPKKPPPPPPPQQLKEKAKPKDVDLLDETALAAAASDGSIPEVFHEAEALPYKGAMKAIVTAEPFYDEDGHEAENTGEETIEEIPKFSETLFPARPFKTTIEWDGFRPIANPQVVIAQSAFPGKKGLEQPLLAMIKPQVSRTLVKQYVIVENTLVDQAKLSTPSGLHVQPPITDESIEKLRREEALPGEVKKYENIREHPLSDLGAASFSGRQVDVATNRSVDTRQYKNYTDALVARDEICVNLHSAHRENQRQALLEVAQYYVLGGAVITEDQLVPGYYATYQDYLRARLAELSGEAIPTTSTGVVAIFKKNWGLDSVNGVSHPVTSPLFRVLKTGNTKSYYLYTFADAAALNDIIRKHGEEKIPRKVLESPFYSAKSPQGGRASKKSAPKKPASTKKTAPKKPASTKKPASKSK